MLSSKKGVQSNIHATLFAAGPLVRQSNGTYLVPKNDCKAPCKGWKCVSANQCPVVHHLSPECERASRAE